jgi:hypothetical protein
MAARPGTGRIHPHQRDANFSGNLLGDDIVLDESHVTSVQSTEQFMLDVDTKQNHRNRIKHIYTYWKTEFPAYYNVGVKELTSEELGMQTRFYWKNKFDIVYSGLNTKFLKVFLAMKIVKLNGKTLSYEHIRKYFDAVQFGAKETGVLLPVSFFQDKDKFLSAFKKQVAKAKGSGDTDEQEADPIPMDLYVLICTWAIGGGNIMMWMWTTMHWNLMGRSVNIEPISLHNLCVFGDSIQFLYDKNKGDPTGEKTTIKHVYANPLNPFICGYLSLGIYLCLNAEKFTKSEFVFRNVTDRKKNATNGYCSQLKELLNRNKDVVMSYIRLAHANAHGWK